MSGMSPKSQSPRSHACKLHVGFSFGYDHVQPTLLGEEGKRGNQRLSESAIFLGFNSLGLLIADSGSPPLGL